MQNQEMIPGTKHICTYFDKNFLARGLALYDSIRKYHTDFIFYVLTFDNESYEYLTSLNKSNIQLISHQEYNNYYNTIQTGPPQGFAHPIMQESPEFCRSPKGKGDETNVSYGTVWTTKRTELLPNKGISTIVTGILLP